MNTFRLYALTVSVLSALSFTGTSAVAVGAAADTGQAWGAAVGEQTLAPVCDYICSLSGKAYQQAGYKFTLGTAQPSHLKSKGSVFIPFTTGCYCEDK